MKIIGIQPQKIENINIVTRGTIGEPLGLAKILAIAQSKGHEIMYIPYINSIDDLLSDVEAFLPDIVLFSIMTSQYYLGEEIAKKIKHIFPDTIIIAGGYHPSSNIKLSGPFDFFVKGEGEIPFEQLLTYFQNADNRTQLNEIPGISYYDENNTYISNPPERILDIDNYPLPIRNSTIFQQKYYGLIYPHYTDQSGFAYIEYSRGCVNSCSFCCKEAMYKGSKIVFRDPINVVAEIKSLIEKNVNLLFFTDLNFTVNHQKVFDLCNEIIKNNIKISWFCMSNVNTADDIELLKTMADAGCVKMMYGVESVSNGIINDTKKDNNNLHRIMTQTASSGILCQIFYMIGFPWEKDSDVYNAIPQIIQIPAHQIRIGIATPLPGSVWFNDMKQEGLCNVDWSLYDTENFVWKENKFSDINSLVKDICRQFYTTNLYSERLDKFLYLHPKYTESFNCFFNSLVELEILEKNEFKINNLKNRRTYEK
ncbi:MAG: B12-binding domain-containing radical SAM protein [Fibromonadaceae bacterium]|jgi:radical SAM superfamily enzyme YgiQ (UPF0313 family)|nr:B12-binding domain-containing radical SAM protein [Fibromonadaceae bacterium]